MFGVRETDKCCPSTISISNLSDEFVQQKKKKKFIIKQEHSFGMPRKVLRYPSCIKNCYNILLKLGFELVIFFLLKMHIYLTFDQMLFFLL